MTKFSIVINNHDWSRCCDTIRSICQCGNFINEIIVLNAAGDDTNKLLEREMKSATISYFVIDREKISSKQALEMAVEKCTGDYINVVDSGIFWETNYLSCVSERIEKNADSKKIVLVNSMPVSKDKGYAEYRSELNKSKYINLLGNPRVLNIFYHGCFFKADVLKDFEDFGTLSMILWAKIFSEFNRKQIVSAVSNTSYCLVITDFYKSPIENCFSKSDQFAHFLKVYFTDIFAQNDSKYVSRNCQYILLYFINQMLTKYTLIEKNFDSDEILKIKETVFHSLQYIEETMILASPYLAPYYKNYLLIKKCGEPTSVKYGNSESYFIDNNKLGDSSNCFSKIQFASFTKNSMYIEGYTKTILADTDIDIFVKVNGVNFKCEEIKYCEKTYWFDELIQINKGFAVTIPLDNGNYYQAGLFAMENGREIEKLNLSFGKYAPLTENMPESYFVQAGWLMTYSAGDGLIQVHRSSEALEKSHEKAFQKAIRATGRLGSLKALLVRKMCLYLKKHRKNDIWLLSDRINRGDDNGEAMFRYLCENKELIPNKDVYFVVDKKTPEYNRIKQYGKVISTLSWKHKLYHLLAEYIISSQGNNPVVNPFQKSAVYYKDILSNMKFVFLQHGITKDNQAAWLNKYNRNIYGLIVTTHPEYDSMLEYEYYYTPERIWLTGMPRYDLLYHNEKKYVTIMPTWRKSLMKGADVNTGIWLIRDDFSESSYFKFYNSLLNSKRLVDGAKEYGYKICYMAHPNMAPYMNQFDTNKEVLYFDENKTYREVFAETDVMVTDYSSVAFDFAYLKKPIVYTQFDRDEFFSGSHSYTEGYFNYETDGFGEVELDLDSTIDRLLDYMKNGCEIKDKYVDRINNTFAYTDHDCCKRVLDKLLDTNNS